MDPIIGTILPIAFNWAPKGWALCNGQLLNIASNSALFSLLGTQYGGNGTTTFGLPNLQGRVAIGQGNGAGLSPYVQGQVGGFEGVTLIQSQMPQHTHIAALQVSNAQANLATPVAGNNIAAPGTGGGRNPFVPVNGFTAAAPNVGLNANSVTVQLAGGSLPHENRQPYLVINYIIALVGIYPSRP